MVVMSKQEHATTKHDDKRTPKLLYTIDGPTRPHSYRAKETGANNTMSRSATVSLSCVAGGVELPEGL